MDSMVRAMTERQLAFWRALTAPFPRAAYKEREGAKGRMFTYLDSRTIMNRIDDVVGPGNWDLEFRDTIRGMVCRITIEAPDMDGNPKKVSREGGGGFRSMQDDDSTFKTGFSSAIKTAASCLGIGRELYGEGMPAYCADLHDGNASGTPSSGAGSGPPPRGERSNGDHGGGSNGRTFDKFKPPFGKPGKAPYAWAMKMGEHFGNGTDVLGRMTAYAEKRKKSKFTNDWDEAFTDECLAKTVSWLRTLPNYDGEFGDEPQSAQDSAPAPAPVQATSQPLPIVASITAAVSALITKQTGRDATAGEVVACIQELASSVINGSGHRGEVLQSLRNCTDKTWLMNILAAANKKIQEVAIQAHDDDDEIPF